MTRNGPTAKAYPTEPQYNRWSDRADELDMSTSEFIQSMVEAGMKVEKGFDVEVAPDESARELRRQRNDMKKEVDRLRERVSELEEELHDHERESVKQYLQSQHQARFNQLVKHVRSTAPQRVDLHLDALPVEVKETDDERYYRLVEDRGEE